MFFKLIRNRITRPLIRRVMPLMQWDCVCVSVLSDLLSPGHYYDLPWPVPNAAAVQNPVTKEWKWYSDEPAQAKYNALFDAKTGKKRATPWKLYEPMGMPGYGGKQCTKKDKETGRYESKFCGANKVDPNAVGMEILYNGDKNEQNNKYWFDIMEAKKDAKFGPETPWAGFTGKQIMISGEMKTGPTGPLQLVLEKRTRKEKRLGCKFHISYDLLVCRKKAAHAGPIVINDKKVKAMRNVPNVFEEDQPNCAVDFLKRPISTKLTYSSGKDEDACKTWFTGMDGLVRGFLGTFSAMISMSAAKECLRDGVHATHNSAYDVQVGKKPRRE